ncbi:MAG: DUF4369 domain-containing protein [Bacteroidetes bacterium]|nr:DUF4369 domain-containing protein [Bacteroidota bacterium]
MKNRLITVLFAVLTISCANSQISAKGYNINIKVEGLSEAAIYLAYHLGNKQYIKDSTTLDKNGTGSFRGTVTLDHGVYIMVLPGNRYFEFIVGDDQEFSITYRVDDPINSVSFNGSHENEAFIAFQNEWAELHRESAALRARLTASNQNKDSIMAISQKAALHEAKMKSFINSTIQKNGNNFVAVLVKGMLPSELPDFNIPEGTGNRDSLMWVMTYNYNRDHFFDNFDLSDERLLRSPMFHNKIEHYFTQVILQFPDSVISSIDRVFALTGGNRKTFQYIAVFLFNHYRESSIMGHDAIVVKLADDVYLSGKADWASEEFKTNLRKEVDRIRPTLIGNRAINLVMESHSHGVISLQQIESEFLVLYFWEPDCGHCKEATPLLHDFYLRNKPKGIEVFTICTHPDKKSWETYIADNGLKWINGWDPQRTTHYDFFYNITSTPTIYILDSNKKIIAKKLPAESVESFIESYRRHGR